MTKIVFTPNFYYKRSAADKQVKDNIRSLSVAIGDLLRDYFTWVIPLRQIFLRQSAPNAVISPYLWWKNSKACVRASAPKISIAIWQQMTVTIVKTKFAADIACFDADQEAIEKAEDIDADIRAMTSQRNHSTNRAYANQQTNSLRNVLIRRYLLASTLWKDFWGLDTLLESAGKRRRDDLTSMAYVC
ncbi:hypothetical protein BKA65DRAFT_543496 [Rhexocercosporidium sp. MPI-PUGE-AT-0058]|nr:hypothetical protein BKA65DRAFT_543496 [Rhexocercosporidium sp. MPI-PUGE-AT-0058]